MILDTHVLLWAMSQPERIDRTRLAYIEDLSNTVYVSSISVAEIAIKSSIGKLLVDFDLLDMIGQTGFELLDFTARDAVILKDLPFHHRDPFDRMLVAQCRANGFALVSDDEKLRAYDCRVL